MTMNDDILAQMQGGRLRLTVPWETIEDSAKEQIEELLRNPRLETLVVLPDVHWGMNVCIGTVALMRDVVVPSFVGVDIGCGMIQVNTRRTVEELGLQSFEAKKQLFRMMQKVIPHGKGKGNKDAMIASAPYPVAFESAAMPHKWRRRINHRAGHDWGTLGSGNHFIETGVNDKGEVGIALHSGSRSPGYNIGVYYVQMAEKLNPGAAPYFEITSEIGQAYYSDMHWALDYAAANRLRMMEKLLPLFGLDMTESGLAVIEKTHNHAVWDKETNMVLHRKGATPANAGELGIIPGNQLDGIYVIRGLGNGYFLCSSSHGAGRAMSRTQA
ncbi:MAG: RtcB family protein, partial [Deltaproteobacteria bacterium]|nr:RtcB family protein [Deltaproteobacteria bacterium]